MKFGGDTRYKFYLKIKWGFLASTGNKNKYIHLNSLKFHVRLGDYPIFLKIATRLIWWILVNLGLVLVPYCVLYLPHAMPFLRNKIPYSLLNLQNHLRFRGLKHSKCPNFSKIKGKNSQLRPFIGLFCHFFVIQHECPYFQE